MDKFLKKLLLLFPIPFIIVFVPVYILLVTDEGVTPEFAISYQENDKSSKLGFAYNENTSVLKLIRTMQLNPDILILGTSRSMQFGNQFFSSQYSFYNAGGAVSEMEHFLPFMNKTEVTPQLLIIVLDQYFFNESWVSTQPENYLDIVSMSFQTVLQNNISRIWQDILKGKIPFKFSYNTNLGLLAKVTNDGFRYDGSYDYCRIMENPETSLDYMFVDTKKRISKGIRRFQYANDLYNKSIIELNNLLSYCSKKEIYVVGILPPYAPEIWAIMRNNEYNDRYLYLSLIPDEIAPLFVKWKFSFFDFSDGLIVNSIDNEFIDGFHGSKKTYARMALKLRTENEVSKYLKSEEDLLRWIEVLPSVNVKK
jgi:hypothetical protein